MINAKIVEAWLNRETNNYDWAKQKSEAAYDRHFAKLDPPPDFNGVKLWKHQKAALTLLNQLNRFIFHIDMGGGKTLTTLLFLRYKKQCGQKPRAIVFVPYLTSVETWVEEVEKHTPDLRVVPLLGSCEENLADLQLDADLFVICYQSAVAMVSAKGGAKWHLSPDLLATAFNKFNFMVCDEIHKTKGRTTLTFDMCKWISDKAIWAVGLTGTPFGRDLQDLWPQFYLIDFGETLGKTISLYREAFFNYKINYWGGREYTFRKNMMPQLHKMIKNRSIHYGLDEFHDMPPKKYVPERLRLPEASKSYVKASIDNIKQALKGKDPTAYRVVESEYLILRQLASGFMTLKGEDDERIHVKFDDNPKLEALEGLLEQLPPDCKMVVFHHFVYTNGMISELLTGMKIKHARIWGGQRDPVGQLRLFKDTSDCRVLVINSKSGSSSLNLQGANYIVFFEQPDSPIDRQQAEARCWRPGQEKRVFIYDLLAIGTMDERIHHANKAGEDLLKQLLEGRIEL
jgi:SNF2 family DNA or RNA helicase